MSTRYEPARESLNQLTHDGLDPSLRFLTLQYAQIPESMSTSDAIAQMRNPGALVGRALREFSLSYAYPVHHRNFHGYRANAVRITPERGTTLQGGQGPSVAAGSEEQYYGSGLPAGLTVSSQVFGVCEGDEDSTKCGNKNMGRFELLFQCVGQERLRVVGSSQSNHFFEFELDYFNEKTRVATGSFMFIGSNGDNSSDTRRWAIFDGEFSLGVP